MWGSLSSQSHPSTVPGNSKQEKRRTGHVIIIMANRYVQRAIEGTRVRGVGLANIQLFSGVQLERNNNHGILFCQLFCLSFDFEPT